MHQIVHTGQRIVDAEFLLQNPLHILGAQGANAIGLGRSAQNPLLEGRFLRIRQLGWTAGLPFGTDRLQSSVTVGIHPSLHEVLAAGQHVHDRFGAVTVQR